MSAAEIVLHEPETLFAPVVWSPAGRLLEDYALVIARIRETAAVMQSELGSVLHYFTTGNQDPDRPGSERYIRAMFDLSGAEAAANADFWKRALNLTDIYSCLPQPRREQWDRQFRERKTPEFNEDNLRATLESFQADRMLFLAERVDGIFRVLSGDHVTNQPNGFNTRMIIAGAYNYGDCPDHSRSGSIHDLRCVIAKFMGREDPGWYLTSEMMRKVRRETGKWWPVDGGALRIRVYKIGTAHREVHPEMAWRLNAVLANLHPSAIPPPQRQRPTKKSREWATMQRPLPGPVLAILANADNVRHDRGGKTIQLRDWDADKHVRAEAHQVLESIGGVEVSRGMFEFDYPPFEVINEIIVSGCVPDQKSHQFYPTPEAVARLAVEMAEIEPHHACLEPSAGTGALVEFMPKTTQCIEISSLRALVLHQKGFPVVQCDFLEFARTTPFRFNRIVMNPPFSQGRAAAHVQAAAKLLKAGGRLVAILPASMRGAAVVDGLSARWSEVFANEFAGTSVAVAVCVMESA